MAVATQLRKEDVVRVDGQHVFVKFPEFGEACFYSPSHEHAVLRSEQLWDLVSTWIAEANRRHIDVGQ